MATKTRSTERDPIEVDTFRKMTDVLQRVWDGQQQAQLSRHTRAFKAPEFNGKTDVEFFIVQFSEVAEANEWPAAAGLLHLRETLKEGARDCGRAASIGGIFTALRARYGFSPREARAKLSVLRKDGRETLQEHASEVSRLSRIAYGDLPAQHREELALETFCNTLGNMPLQRHLLAVQARTLEEAVRAGNEFWQIKVPASSSSANIRVLGEDEDVADDCVTVVKTDPMSAVVKLLEQLSVKLDRLGSTKPVASRPVDTRTGCWGCGQEGHSRRNCPTNPWQRAPATTVPLQGNADSPQQ
jgi:hypothetical protein